MNRNKEKKKKMNTKKTGLLGSLKRQITLVFVCIVAAAIAASILVNHVFLEKVYVHDKENAIMNVYSSIVAECENGDMNSAEFELTLEKYSSNYNVSIVIISSLFEPIKVYSNEPEQELIREMSTNLRGTIAADRLIEENDSYVFIEKSDARTQAEYLEMMGILPNGSFFLLRTTLESIRISADIANRFLLYVGIGAIVISALVIYFFTSRISKPILELANISERMSQMDFEAKYEGKDKNEIAVLGRSMNRMSENLERTISDLKLANEQLKEDNDLKTRIDEMRKEFISNVSHELKTPIALIQGYAEGLKEVVDEEEERDYYCDVIMDEASKMNTMVRQLLTLNQLESGEDILSCDYFDISALIRNYVQSSEIITNQNGITVKVSVPDECRVYADEFKIEEVFMNFFTNACNHCESDTQKEIDVWLEKEENGIRVCVFNTGKQIPEESIGRIWDKFYKVDKARTREYGGSGVGLSIVKAIMAAHGSECGVANREDGVCFWFYIKEERMETAE